MTKQSEKLTARDRELKILSVLAEGREDFGYFGFETISRQTRIERRVIRLDVRRMARKGFTQYGKGLWNGEGEPMGSGYAITPAGRALLQSQGDST